MILLVPRPYFESQGPSTPSVGASALPGGFDDCKALPHFPGFLSSLVQLLTPPNTPALPCHPDLLGKPDSLLSA